MADHLDAPGLMSPRGNARTDITDIYAFQKPGEPDKSILILNVNPLAPTLANSFEHNGLYQLKIDTDADTLAEIVFRIAFSAYSNGHQTATVRRAIGAAAERNDNSGEIIINNAPCSFTRNEQITTVGAYKFFAGWRSDPFFFDLVGFMHGLKFTGSDFFADKDVFSIVLEVPNTALGNNPKIGIWGTTYLNGVRDDRMGRPAINTVFNHGEDKNIFNQINPSQDRALFLNKFVRTLESFGHSNVRATEIARILLPDILTYDYSSPEGYLNGRKLTDDVIDISLALITNGKVKTDKVGPHHDYLANFPYVGRPHHA